MAGQGSREIGSVARGRGDSVIRSIGSEEAIQKPETMDQYIHWLRRSHGAEISRRTEAHYNAVTSTVKLAFEQSLFWTQLIGKLRDYNDEYLTNTGYGLLVPTAPEIVVKPYSSFLQKTFRKNVLQNERWPEAPEGGWVTPENWYALIHDIIRTLLVVKYLDGVTFLLEKVRALCEQCGVRWDISFEAREEGYYAAHVNVIQEFEIPRVTWDTERVTMSVEIQVTTQLQEVIRTLLHKYYEARRQSAGRRGDTKWQWDYQSDEFAANYLGHVLHYVEGMIMEVRQRQRGEVG